MKRILILFFLLASLCSFGQTLKTDAALSTQSTDEIKNKSLNQTRFDTFFQDLITSKLSRYQLQKTVSTSTYSLTNSDTGYEIHCTNAAGCTVTLPNTLSTNTIATFRRDAGAGTITFVSDGTSTLDYNGTAATLETVASVATWIKFNATRYDGFGQLGSTSSASGTVTSVTSANANITVANSTTTPVLTIVAAPTLTDGDKGDFTFASGVATLDNLVVTAAKIATMSSANLRTILTDEVGTGAAYFVGGALATPASGDASNLTGLPIATGLSGGAANKIPYFTSSTALSTSGAPTFDGTNLGIGATPQSILTVSKQTSIQAPVTGSTAQFTGLDANPLRITFDTHNNASSSGTALMFRRSRGTGATPLALATDDVIASFNGRGYGTTQYAAASTGLMSIKANQTFTDANNGTYISFETTPDNSVTANEAFRILGNRTLTAPGYSTNGGILYTNASGLFSQTGAGTSGTVLHGGTSPSYGQVAIGTEVSGLGTNVATWLGTPSYTNFLAAVTGTSPYYLLASGGTLTGVNTLTSNTNSQHIFTGTWTATGNNQYHALYSPTITGSGTASHVTAALSLKPAFTAGNSSQSFPALNIEPTWNDNAQSTVLHPYIRCYDGSNVVFSVLGSSSVFGSSNNTLTINNGVAGPKIEASSGSLQLNANSATGNNLLQIAGNSWFGIRAANAVGASVFAVNTTVTSAATQTNSRNFNLEHGMWNGAAAETNFWTMRATASTATNNLAYYDIFYGNTPTAPSLTNLHFRIKSTNGNIYIGAGTTTTADPTSRLEIAAGSTTANTAPIELNSGALETTIRVGLVEYNNSHYVSNNALNRYGIGGPIADFTTDVNNTSTTETDLLTYTTKASTLSATGEKLAFDASGTFNDITSTAQVQFYFGGTNIGNTGALTVSATGAWTARILIIRTGSTTARAQVNISTPSASTASYTSETDITGLTFTNTNILKITGTAGGASGGSNDITAKMGTIIFWPAANN
jgi:hypothetical protein